MFIPSRLAVAVALTALAGNAAAEGAFAQLYAVSIPLFEANFEKTNNM